MKSFAPYLIALAVLFGGCNCNDTTGTDTPDDPDVEVDAGNDGGLEPGCVDEDGDGYGTGADCDGRVDCDDTDPDVRPLVEEACFDDVDNDCDGTIDEGCADCESGATRDCGDDTGACRSGTQSCVDGVWSECEGEIAPTDEICNGEDDDCDGEVDENPEFICNDGLLCNGVEVCEESACVAYDVPDCGDLDGACTEGICSEKDGGCVATPKENGSACDDGDFCTIEGTCNSGVCESQPRDCSGEGDQCNVGVCDEATDSCVPQPVSDGTACDDGAFCTTSDTCNAGVCGGAARDCTSAGDQCNSGVCDEAADACVKQAVTDGTSCEDGEYCTVGDACAAGACMGGGPRSCGAAGGSCREGVCDEATDSCDGDPVPDGTACDDGQFCTTSDQCVAGTCAGGAPRDCSSADATCRVGTCDDNLNLCVATPAPDGTTCDDGAFCTTGDSCAAGSCTGAPRDCSGAADACNNGSCSEASDSCVPQPKSDGTLCPDSLFCTQAEVCSAGTCNTTPRDCSGVADQCNAGACDDAADLCVPAPLPDGTSCDDGESCTVNDSCTTGACGGAARDCDSVADACNTGMCDAATGNCMAVPLSDGTTCDDADLCTVSDECTAGDCGGSPKDCSMLDDACNIGVCDPATGGCTTQPRPNGTSCSDGDMCTDSDVCMMGSCIGTMVDCTGLDGECSTGVCNPSNGMCEASPAPNGQSCDDGAACTTGDQCTNGTCAGTTVDCSGLDTECGTGTCNPVNGTCFVQNAANGSSCDDGSACTTGDQCSNGICGGTDKDCSSLDGACSTGVCNPSNGACEAQLAANGSSCDDGSLCTTNDTCSSGTCSGSAVDCTSLDRECSTGVCNPLNGSCASVRKSNGTSCNDGSLCTTGDACSDGVCAGAAVDCSGSGDECNTGECRESDGACVAVPVPNGSSCNDDLYCTDPDTCTNGVCGGPTRSCISATDDCNTGTCDEANDRCIGVPVADGSDCDDGLFCTDPDQCVSGACVGQGTTDCTPGVACEIGVCDEGANQCTTEPDPACCDNSVDADLDGYGQCDDCDDANASVRPNGTERCNGFDDDCDGAIDEDFDNDSDGFSVCSTDPDIFDCDDSNPNINPGIAENCDDGSGGNTGNGIDDDCDGYIDEGCNPCTTTDVDGDDWSECEGDCNDNAPTIYPGANELCDGVDNDCNLFTVENCGASQSCNFDGDGDPSNDADICGEDLLCSCILDRSGTCRGDYRCIPFCNSSQTGVIGDGCQPNEICNLTFVGSANVNGCSVVTDTLGNLAGGASCSSDSQCRSGQCEKPCVGPGCNNTVCRDRCTSDAECAAGAVCRLSGSGTLAGSCVPAGLFGDDALGTSCTSDFACASNVCVDDPNTGSDYCTSACCTDTDCGGGYYCSFAGSANPIIINSSIRVFPPEPDAPSCSSNANCAGLGEGLICFQGQCTYQVYGTSGQCVREVSGQGTRRGGQACSQNSQCRSNFCEKDLGICVEPCCADSTCPSGTACELSRVESADNQGTSARICLSLSTDEVFERM